MEFTKNGVQHNPTIFNNTLIALEQDGQKGKRLDLRCNVDGGTFVVSVSNWEWQNPPVNGVLVKSYDTESGGQNTNCKSVNSANLCDAGLGTFAITSANKNYMSFDDSNGLITISANDPSAKTVSGNFSFTTEDLISKDTIMFVGSFKNLTYTSF